MKKVFVISGGAGRVICALPALQKYYKIHGPNFYILSESGMELFFGHSELQDLVFDLGHKGLFENIIKPNELVTPEPYREHGYYNQQKSLTESFDKLINNTDDHSDLEKPKIILSQTEEIQALDILANAKELLKKEKTIVIQPFGRGCMMHKSSHTFDQGSRSLSTNDYFYISERLRKLYNVISFTELKFENDPNMYVSDASLRIWASVISAADYFVGIDSVGQHMAHVFDTPGSVILGSTFVENISYPEYFHIVEKKNNKKRYNPIRIHGLDGDLVERHNDSCMNFTKQELEEITDNILRNIHKKIGGGSSNKKIGGPLHSSEIKPALMSGSLSNGFQQSKTDKKNPILELQNIKN